MKGLIKDPAHDTNMKGDKYKHQTLKIIFILKLRDRCFVHVFT